MRVAWVRAVGRTPEEDAWRSLRAWAGPAGLLDDHQHHPVFGFDNPAPSGGADAYGYELWIAVDAGVEPPEGVGLRDFPGGLYAVTSCPLRGGAGVPACWKALLRWVHASEHAWRRSAHELERIRDPLAADEDTVLDLYLPIEG
jgi:DNA gyrase inhibitor GyrI